MTDSDTRTPPFASFRELTAQDGGLLVTATLENVNWCGERFTRRDVRDHPDLAHYTHLVPERGDLGVVAVREGRGIGVAWALFLPADHPGYGFVDDATPEVSLWVASAERRQGIGRTLLRRLAARCAERGVPRLSLSVEDGNHARGLYLAEGYVPVPGREADGVMVTALR